MALHFIFFGSKVRDKDYGKCYPIHCANCDNDVYYHAVKWREWFHIYWIPMVPWFSTKELVCPICGLGVELERNEFKAAKELVEKTERFRKNAMPEKEYQWSVNEFEESIS